MTPPAIEPARIAVDGDLDEGEGDEEGMGVEVGGAEVSEGVEMIEVAELELYNATTRQLLNLLSIRVQMRI